MKILMVNNRLKVYGGEGTYMTSLGDELIRQSNDVQYFGLEDPDSLHGNRYGIYAKSSKNPFKLLKNSYNRKQFAKILDAFKPDIIHLNLVYFTLTPSILIEAKKRNIKVVQTIHDGKMVCPSYQLFIHRENKSCTLCVNGDFKNCVKHVCHKNSILLSYIAYREANYNRKKGYYNLIDKFIFPSAFMKDLHTEFGLPEDKCFVISNFTRINKRSALSDKNDKYVLFFGRVIKIKGAELVIKAAEALPDVKFVVAGVGDMLEQLKALPNVKTTGFLNQESLSKVIEKAYISVFPSICLENCPMSIAESVSLGTPVLGSRVGGIPELIDENITGLTFDSLNVEDFIHKIQFLIQNEKTVQKMSHNCLQYNFLSCSDYAKKILLLYNDVLANH